jgi:RNA polymerase sigma-70 factor (ECF subfamily)
LKADASFSMPPLPAWYQGRESIGRLASATVFSGAAAGRWRLRHLRASGGPAVGLYRLDGDSGRHRAYGVQVITFDGDKIADLTACLNPALARPFGMPEVWPEEGNHG